MLVDVAAVNRINEQNLSWKASLKTAFEGLQIKQFGLGLNSRSDVDRQAFLLELMASRASSSTPTRTAPAAQLGAQEAPSSPLPAAAPRSTHEESLTPKPLSSRLRAARSQTRSTPGDIAPPAAFDARDIYEGQAPCKAFQPLDQGGCGACYAFSSAVSFSARLCSTDPSSSVRNVIISPQSLLDCAQGGCTGGDVLSTLASLVDKPVVELWCDPYSGTQKSCGSTCGTSNTYGGEPGSVRQVGGAGEAGVVQMQLELVRGGPGVVGLTVMNDLFSYSSGVYSPSASATVVGRHAVSLIGWGEDNGVAYWICQNSWGATWGEQGFFRIARGADTCGIESSSGLAVVKPLIEPLCPTADCAYAAMTLRDCSCQCPSGLSGSQCQDCALSCGGGGAVVDSCTRCECPMGVWGGDPECNSGFQVSSLASCGQDPPSSVTVEYSFSGAASPPTQTSFVGVYSLDETSPVNSVASAPICGSTYPSYDPATNGGLCPSQGSFQLSRPTVPGQYKIVVAPFSPLDSNGLQG
jgi:cathepsin B